MEKIREQHVYRWKNDTNDRGRGEVCVGEETRGVDSFIAALLQAARIVNEGVFEKITEDPVHSDTHWVYLLCLERNDWR
jgi:hypothetical protein